MPERKIKEKCPICGMDVITDKYTADYKGQSYYFCTEIDKRMFLGDPEKYISKSKVA